MYYVWSIDTSSFHLQPRKHKPHGQSPRQQHYQNIQKHLYPYPLHQRSYQERKHRTTNLPNTSHKANNRNMQSPWNQLRQQYHTTGIQRPHQKSHTCH